MNKNDISDRLGRSYRDDGTAVKHEGPWERSSAGLFEKSGVYRVRVKGNLVRKGASSIPFTSGDVRIELGVSNIAQRASLIDEAEKAIIKRYGAAPISPLQS